MSKVIARTGVLTGPPNIPLSYSHFENGMFYYTSTCCPTLEHYGLIASTQEIPPNKLGCSPGEPIEGPGVEISGVAPFTTGERVIRELDNFLGNGNIRNADTVVAPFHMNPVGVEQIMQEKEVNFSTRDQKLQLLFENRKFRLRSLKVTFPGDRQSPPIEFTHYVAICIARDENTEYRLPLDNVAASPAYPDPTAPTVNEGRLMTARLLGHPLFITNNVA